MFPVGERITVPSIALARSPPLEVSRQQQAPPDPVFEAIPEPEFERTANLGGGSGS